VNNTDQQFDAIVGSLGLPGPRVTLAMVEEILATVTYEARVIKGTTVTQAVAILPSGFVLATGQAGCADPANFNVALGIERAISKARDLARDAIWHNEGYRLAQALYEVRQGTATAALQQIRAILKPADLVAPDLAGYAPHEVRVIQELAELDDKIGKLCKFLGTKAAEALPGNQAKLLKEQSSAMMRYSRALADRIAEFRPAPASMNAGASD